MPMNTIIKRTMAMTRVYFDWFFLFLSDSVYDPIETVYHPYLHRSHLATAPGYEFMNQVTAPMEPFSNMQPDFDENLMSRYQTVEDYGGTGFSMTIFCEKSIPKMTIDSSALIFV